MSRRYTATCDEQLSAFLLSVLETKRTAVKNLLKFGAVEVNGVVVRQFDHRLAAGDQVSVGDLRAAAAIGRLTAARIQPVYEDDALIVLDKPAGLLTVATDRDKTDTLFVRVNEYLRDRDSKSKVRAAVVHRLDQGTSGLVLFAKSANVKDVLQANWPAVRKTYRAIVEGRPDPPQGTIQSHLTETKSLKVFSSDRPTPESRPATTHFRVLGSRDGLSLVEIELETGRKHQIRVHMARLGCPVAGDERYGAKSDPFRRLALHAFRLELSHPISGERLSCTAPLPPALGKPFSTSTPP